MRGRKREIGLGSVVLVSLAEAREQALANRKLARAGGDPLAEKRRSHGVPTFAEAAGRVIEQKRAGWRSPKTARLWIRSLEMYAFPRLGNVPVSEITSGDVLETLSPIWHARPKVARAVRLRFRAVSGEGNLEDRMALAGEHSVEIEAEHDFSLRLLRHLAGSVRHQKYHDTDILAVRVEAPAG